jgi:nucleoside-diphosphate-sugar epimerase
VPSIKKAEQLLGWSPTTTFDEALIKTVDYYLSIRPA